MHQIKYLFLGISLLVITNTKAQNYGIAKATNVDFQHIGFTGDIKITYDLENCDMDNFYYVTVSHEDNEIRHKMYPSNWAVIGANKETPMKCGYNKEIVWKFSEEVDFKKTVGEGDFVVDVFTISKEENKKLFKDTKKYDKKRTRLEDKIARAKLKGKTRKIVRLEKRLNRNQNRYLRKNG